MPSCFTMRCRAVGMITPLKAKAMTAVTYRCGAAWIQACQATAIDSAMACIAKTFSRANIRSW
jgi:hypothetical protein